MKFYTRTEQINLNQYSTILCELSKYLIVSSYLLPEMITVGFD